MQTCTPFVCIHSYFGPPPKILAPPHLLLFMGFPHILHVYSRAPAHAPASALFRWRHSVVLDGVATTAEGVTAVGCGGCMGRDSAVLSSRISFLLSPLIEVLVVMVVVVVGMVHVIVPAVVVVTVPAVVAEPLTLAWPRVSADSVKICGRFGGGGSSVGRGWGGGRGVWDTSLVDGKERPCMRVFTSFVLVVFLYQLTCDIKVHLFTANTTRIMDKDGRY